MSELAAGGDLSFNPFFDAEYAPQTTISVLLWSPLALLRIFAAVFWTAVYLVALSMFLLTESAILIVVAILIPGASDENSLPLLRGVFLQLQIWLTQIVGNLICWACGFQLRISGKENLRKVRAMKAPYVVVVNHSTLIDTPIVAAVLGPYAAVATSWTQNVPLIGQIAQRWKCIFVDPSKARSGQSDMVLERARKAGAGVYIPPLLVFPEGTVTNNRALIKFRTTAFRADLPVLPVVIKYSSGSDRNLAWVPPHTTASALISMFLEPSKMADITVLPPMAISRDESGAKDQGAEFARRVQLAMGSALASSKTLSGKWERDVATTGRRAGAAYASTEWDAQKGHAFWKSIKAL